MSTFRRTGILFGISLACTLASAPGWCQDTKTSSTAQNGQATVTTEVKSAEVVYVSGNDVVVKMDDGQIKNVVVPEDTKFTVDGNELTVHDLKPGMHLTRTLTTTSTPRTVTTVRTVSGKVWYVNPPSTLILTLADGTNKEYRVPKGQMFEMNGEKHDLFDLRKGMQISATAVTEAPEVVQTSTRTVTGTAPPALATPPATPPAESVLLIEEPASNPAPQPEAAPAELPKTGSVLPLIGLLGLLCFGAAFGLRVYSRP